MSYYGLGENGNTGTPGVQIATPAPSAAVMPTTTTFLQTQWAYDISTAIPFALGGAVAGATTAYIFDKSPKSGAVLGAIAGAITPTFGPPVANAAFPGGGAGAAIAMILIAASVGLGLVGAAGAKYLGYNRVLGGVLGVAAPLVYLKLSNRS